MDTAERNTLINDLIKENRDATISDYLEILQEVEGITQSMIITEQLNAA